ISRKKFEKTTKKLLTNNKRDDKI
ncbi:hypothetical protein Q604_UNBC01841G0001, partial [human gut metagenome]